MNILRIDSSILGEQSVSRSLTGKVVADLCEFDPDARVTARDLAQDTPAHLTGDLLPALRGQGGRLSIAQEADLKRTEAWLGEFLAADILVVGVPQYNFSVPSQLKAWIDRITQPGRTFRYTANGPVGLAGCKRAIVISSRGGVRADPNSLDLHEQVVDVVFRFLGITDIAYVRAHGLAMGDESREAGLASARAAIEALRESYLTGATA